MNELTKTIRQGSVDFSLNYKVQTTWGFQEALIFALEGIGAIVFFTSFVLEFYGGMVLGLVVLCASAVLLLSHLGSPKNMVYVMANFRHSWMSRGAVILPLFVLLGLIAIVLPVKENNVALTGLFFMLTLFVTMKSGLVMGSFSAIDFWKGGMLPILLALNGLASGVAVLAFVIPADLFWIFPVVVALLLIAIIIYLLTIGQAGRAAKISVDLVNRKHFHSFYSLSIVFGLVVPMIIGIFITMVPAAVSLPVLLVMTVLRIVGDVAMRNVILKAGVYDKVL